MPSTDPRAGEYVDSVNRFLFELDARIPSILIHDDNEPLIQVEGIDDMQLPMGATWLRTTVFDKVSRIHAGLLQSGRGLKIYAGWRNRRTQEQYRAAALVRVLREYPDSPPAERELIASRYAAPLAVAPHCTGGAVDVTMFALATGQEVEMGTQYLDFTPHSYIDSPSVGSNASVNRQELARRFRGEGFFSLPTEWWHFSYGTAEWAAYSERDVAFYGEVSP